jgi:hypothetical protein
MQGSQVSYSLQLFKNLIFISKHIYANNWIEFELFPLILPLLFIFMLSVLKKNATFPNIHKKWKS